MNRVDAAEARERLHAGGEVAFLDLREAGQFGEAHPLFAVPAPYSRLELVIGALVPRLDAPMLLIDAGDGVAERGARRLAALGYRDISIVDGGIRAWERAGFPLYKGVNVPSKTLGELAEEIWHPPMITAEELAQWKDAGRAFTFYDTRPPAEYAKMRVPGAACLPNGELAHRLDAIPDAEPLVITCAGRTRGIIGAIGLQLLGAGDRVRALENGTQGWALAGHELERGNEAGTYPDLTPAAQEASRKRASTLQARHDIPEIAAADVAAMLDAPERTTHVFDVRAPEEAAADPVPVATHALGGQLVQSTDQWVGTRRSRIILCCDTGLRSALAAFWLRQLGYEVFVAPIDAALRTLASRRSVGPSADCGGADMISARRALKRLNEGARLIDLRPSQAFRAGHVAGAAWGVRPRLDRIAAHIGANREAILVAETPGMAQIAALDLREAGLRRLSVVEGGQAALVREGAAIEASPSDPPDKDAIDFLFFVHDRHDGNLESSRRYLAWETGLVKQLDAAERGEYRLIGPDGPVAP